MGCALIYNLAALGVTSALVERGELNRESSGANAGNIHLQTFDHSADFKPPAERLEAILGLHSDARQAWGTLEAELGADLGVRLGGGLMVSESPAQTRALQRKSAIERRAGVRTEVVSGDEARRRWPYLARRVDAACFCPDEGFANPLLVAPAYVRRAAQQGADVLTNEPLVRIDRDQPGMFRIHTSKRLLSARRVVVAAGARSGKVARLLGVDLAVWGRVLTMSVSEPWPPLMAEVVQHVSRRLSVKQTPSGTFLVGGGYPGQLGRGGLPEPSLASIRANMRTLLDVVPSLGAVRLLRSWGGLIPATDNRTLIAGSVPGVSGLFVLVADITGFTLAPLAARELAESLAAGRDDYPRADFTLSGPLARSRRSSGMP